MTCLAGHGEVGHKLHLDGDGACSLALLATTSVGIEREMSCRDVQLLGERLLSEELADSIPCLHVRGRIGTSALADRGLVDDDKPPSNSPLQGEGWEHFYYLLYESALA